VAGTLCSVHRLGFGRGGGWEYLHVAVDDCSRAAFAEVRAADDGAQAAGFLLATAILFRDLGVHIERVMTDRAYAYTHSRLFRNALAQIGANHKLTPPRHPQPNGKAEAFIKTSLREWAYARLYESNDERLAALPVWLDYYNHHRPHTALRNQPPMSVLVNNLRGKYN
jgi:transposase InsO family protein